jgi:hypothetical protein
MGNKKSAGGLRCADLIVIRKSTVERFNVERRLARFCLLCLAIDDVLA